MTSKKIYYTSHARRRLQRRGILKESVETVLISPDLKLPAMNKKRKRWAKQFGDKFLHVIFEERPNRIDIITAQWPEE
ncbi:DUF4258 domain-containing protein [Candidatus Aerophobetes bacterium]|nr:DUF4258 domain-containing protein [Candidatus Aerophobetes bacterium]